MSSFLLLLVMCLEAGPFYMPGSGVSTSNSSVPAGIRSVRPDPEMVRHVLDKMADAVESQAEPKDVSIAYASIPKRKDGREPDGKAELAGSQGAADMKDHGSGKVDEIKVGEKLKRSL